jgi:tripeptide aminopeptidase
MERDTKSLKDGLLDRFLTYVAIDSTSDPHIEEIPSTPGQWDMLNLLKSQLESLGIADIRVSDHGYIVARLAATKGVRAPSIGFMAHVDTASDVSGKNVSPRIHEGYDGGVIRYQNGLALDPAEYPELREHAGHTLITSDGTTLLGADDKAGVAEIMTALSWFVSHPETAHGQVEVIFTSDEETGRGMNHFQIQDLASACCYTLDGDTLGSVEAECFNAFRAVVTFKGQVIHLGTARGKLVNAVTLAGRFISMLPQNESPEATDNRFGFFCPLEISGNLGSATLDIYLRDFEMGEIERRIGVLRDTAALLEQMYPGGKAEVSATKQYANMKSHIEKNPLVMELLVKAIQQAGVQPRLKVIRGGTDGARLSEMGVPTPNIFTGGHNFHSRLEWVSLDAMEKSVETIINLVDLWANQEALP